MWGYKKDMAYQAKCEILLIYSAQQLTQLLQFIRGSAVVVNRGFFLCWSSNIRSKNRANRNQLSSGFNDENRQQLTEINTTIVKLIEYLKKSNT